MPECEQTVKLFTQTDWPTRSKQVGDDGLAVAGVRLLELGDVPLVVLHTARSEEAHDKESETERGQTPAR